MNWLIIVFITELSYSPNLHQDVNLGSEHHVYNDESYYLTLETKIKLFELLYSKFGLKSKAHPTTDGWTFYPDEVTNIFEAGLEYKILSVGFRHICIHPEIPYRDSIQFSNDYNASFDEFFIRVEAKIEM